MAAIRAIADEVGAKVLFDAAHMSGMIAGRAWQQPLAEGAHLMTMSTYKSLGGPPGGLIVSNDAELTRASRRASRFPASPPISTSPRPPRWRSRCSTGRCTAAPMPPQMAETAAALAAALAERGLPVFRTSGGATASHQLALEAARFGGGQAASKRLRRANILACGIGLPITAVEGDMNGLRLGTPEIVRFGMGPRDMPELAALIARGLAGNEAPEAVAEDTMRFRRRFTTLHFMR